MFEAFERVFVMNMAGQVLIRENGINFVVAIIILLKSCV